MPMQVEQSDTPKHKSPDLLDDGPALGLEEGGEPSVRIPHGVQQQMDEMEGVLEEDEEGQEQSCWARCCTKQTVLRLVVGAVYVAVVLVLVLVVKIQDRIEDVQEMAEQYSAIAGFLLFTIHAVTVVCFLPGTLLSIATTALIFNFWVAFTIIYTSAIVAQTIAFLLGRYMFRNVVSGWANKYKLWRAIDTAVASEGFKVTLMLRAPGMPTSSINWLLGISPVEFWKYSLASAIGIIPRLALYVYFGELFGDFIKAVTGEKDLTTGDYVRIGLSLGLALICFILLIVFLRRALKRTLKRLNAEEAAGDSTQADAEAEEEEEGSPGRRSAEVPRRSDGGSVQGPPGGGMAAIA